MKIQTLTHWIWLNGLTWAFSLLSIGGPYRSSDDSVHEAWHGVSTQTNAARQPAVGWVSFRLTSNKKVPRTSQCCDHYDQLKVVERTVQWNVFSSAPERDGTVYLWWIPSCWFAAGIPIFLHVAVVFPHSLQWAMALRETRPIGPLFQNKLLARRSEHSHYNPCRPKSRKFLAGYFEKKTWLSWLDFGPFRWAWYVFVSRLKIL